jgi:hypothetical protein
MGKAREGKNESDQAKKLDQLVYLEDIHIFGLANLLKRAIIVTALDKIKDLQVINMRGVYLPILNPPDECVKEPILIAFHNFHFCPLLFTLDDNDDDLNTNLNDFHVVNATKTYTYFPLVYSNLEQMKVHFLTQTEDKNAFEHLQNYLKVVEIPTRSDRNDETNENIMPLLGCKIGMLILLEAKLYLRPNFTCDDKKNMF